jgi:hypothetical protein
MQTTHKRIPRKLLKNVIFKLAHKSGVGFSSGKTMRSASICVHGFDDNVNVGTLKWEMRIYDGFLECDELVA